MEKIFTATVTQGETSDKTKFKAIVLKQDKDDTADGKLSTVGDIVIPVKEGNSLYANAEGGKKYKITIVEA